LKEDFLYNLRLLGERDRELEQYDATFAEMRTALVDRDAQLSELHAEVDKREEQIRAERERASEQQRLAKSLADEQFAMLEAARGESERRNAALESELDITKRRLEQLRIELESRFDSDKAQMRLDWERQLSDAERKGRDAVARAELVAAESGARAKQQEEEVGKLRGEMLALRERLEAAFCDVDEARRRAAHTEWLATDAQRAADAARGDAQRELDAVRQELDVAAARFAGELAERERRFETERAEFVRRSRDLEQRLASLTESAARSTAEVSGRERELLALLEVAQNEVLLFQPVS
jgi:chromosome segregation ATPase